MADTDDTPSPEYLALKASMDAWEMWEALTPEQRLQLILDRFPVEAWFYCDPHGEDNLSTLAHFWPDVARRGQIKARFKAIGGNTWDLDKAVEAYIETHRKETSAPCETTVVQDAPLPSTLRTLYTTKPGIAVWLEPGTVASLALIYETDQWEECLAQADQQFKGGGYRVKAAVERHLRESRNGHGLPPFETYSALQAATIPKPTQFFEGLLHEGMLLFGGKSKRGKSWLIYDLALALATGHSCFRHFACPQRQPVLYLALEDGRARLQRRGQEILPGVTSVDNFHLRYSFPALNEGGIELLEKEIRTHHYGLVIIDVLAKVEPPKVGKGDKNYHDIYDMFTPLQALREKQPFCLAMLTHLRKAEAEDVFDALMGSVAYQAAQDVLWVLERKPKDDYAFLHIRDKDADETTIALRFLDGHWEYMGEGEEYEMSRDQRKIVTVLAEEKKEMSIQEILKAASFKEEKYGYLRKLLMTMTKEDIIHRTRHGRYSATIRGAMDFSDAPEERYPGMEEPEEDDVRYR